MLRVHFLQLWSNLSDIGAPKQRFFGMKAHIGVDSRTKLMHTVQVSAANVADWHALQDLLHRKESRVWGDQAYRGQKAAIPAGAPRAKDFTHQRYRWGKRDESVKATNRRKSSVRAKVEHVFGRVANPVAILAFIAGISDVP